MKWVTIVGGLVGLVALLVGVTALVGSRLPREHVASRRVLIHCPPAEVFAAIRDFARHPEWRRDVKSVALLGETNGRLRFREDGAHGSMTMEVVEEVPGVRLVTRIADEDLPFGGSWTYELRPVEGGTEITITERGEVKPAIFRALSKYVFTHHRTIEQYLRALGTRFGEMVTPGA
jgi:uncharacterized protein YndB with AHSA1/START domain